MLCWALMRTFDVGKMPSIGHCVHGVITLNFLNWVDVVAHICIWYLL